MRARTTLTCLLPLIALSSAPALAETHLDEPGVPSGPDEPGLVVSRAVESGLERPFQLELGFGWASLMEDPDVGEGFGGGLFFSYEIRNRVGASLSFFFSKNPYEDTLGEIGTSFLAGSLSLGPSVRLTPAHSRIRLTAEIGLGAYFVIPVIVDDTWTLGLHGGLSLSVPITSWFGVSVKLRYHLFNLATLSGPPMRDVVKSITELGVVDRFEIPVCLAFFF